ncbi:MAG: metallophosphoesterase [Bacteroidia bacterium]
MVRYVPDLITAFLLGLWLAAEVVGYFGLRYLGLWRRWMGWLTPGVFLLSLGLYGSALLWQGTPGERLAGLFFQRLLGWIFLAWLSVVVGKLLGGLWGLGLWIVQRLQTPSTAQSPDVPSLERRAFLQVTGALLASLPAAALAYGFLRGRYRFRVCTVEVALPDLPPAWEGVRIVQFSDLHAGSFSDPTLLKPIWEMIQQLKPDLLVFTGDWVNVYSWELEPFVPDLAQLYAPLGKWSIWGNHDYGDYLRGASAVRKAVERRYLRQLIEQAGFRLLDNAAALLTHQGASLALVGVGNWSRWRRFRRYGDIEAAWRQVPPNTCAILLSHDPTHWDAQILNRYPIALTLSGHTHGLQIGVEALHLRVSPGSWLYPRWAGLYQEGTQFLYVNRGIGYVGLPARLGIWPEITLIHLRRAAPTH